MSRPLPSQGVLDCSKIAAVEHRNAEVLYIESCLLNAGYRNFKKVGILVESFPSLVSNSGFYGTWHVLRHK